MVLGSLAVANEAGGVEVIQYVPKLGKSCLLRTYLVLASLTLTRGRARSSRRRWLCSIRRLSFNSDIDCLPPVRELMAIGFVGYGTRKITHSVNKSTECLERHTLTERTNDSW